MMRALLVLVAMLHACALEFALIARLGADWVPDFAAIVVVFATVALPAERVMLWFAPIALGRALLGPGGLLVWTWLLLGAWVALRPLVKRFFPERMAFQVLAGAFLAAGLSYAAAAILGDAGIDPFGRGPFAWIATGLLTPCVVLVLRGPRRRPALEVAT